MEIIKKYIMSIGITLGLALSLAFIINILNYFDISNNGIYKGLLVVTSILSIAIGAYILGTKSNNKGYAKGLTFGIVITILYIIITLLCKSRLSIDSFIYYLIITITSSIAGACNI